MKTTRKPRQKPRFIVGVDEVGRGPLAGPVAVGAVCVPVGKRALIRRLFRGIRDSKKLSPDARKRFAKLIREEEKKGNLSFCVTYGSNLRIDKEGIANVIRMLVARSLKRLEVAPEETEILLDGTLRAPEAFMNQKMIVKGDDLVLEISMASVAAKVARDLLMIRMGKKYPEYGFQAHKGYGTKNHVAAISEYGLSEIHRTSFCGFL